ncbi:MAG: helicase-associated domain-containing protein [Frankia sp.]
MSTTSFADHLAALREESLAAVLRARPAAPAAPAPPPRTPQAPPQDAPAPRSFSQLAQRLSGPESLATALLRVNADMLVVGQATAALGAGATVAAISRLLTAPAEAVQDAVTELCGLGLAWPHDGMLSLPELLAAHWSAELGAGRPVAAIARHVRAADLRAAATARGLGAGEMRKAQLATWLATNLADTRSLATEIAGLPVAAREHLDALRHGARSWLGGPAARRRDAPLAILMRAGLVLLVDGRDPEVPREVAVAAWLADRTRAGSSTLTGRPRLAPATTPGEVVDRAAQAAAQEALRAITAMLDDARVKPLVALKRGGVGPRERSRLARSLALADDTIPLWIDLAYAAGLLDRAEAGYAPTDAYDRWRAEQPGARWARLATAWFRLEHAPTSRDPVEEKEIPPPLPLGSVAGALRRELLTAARAGVSVAATTQKIDWFFPADHYDPSGRLAKAASAVREAELLGVVAADQVSELGEQLLAVAQEQPADPPAELARRCGALLPELTCSVALQSDLTAVVAGQPTPQAARLLTSSAVPETRGNADVWRFTPASIRAALDSGWTATELRAELGALSTRPVPSALEHLIKDAARRHGQVRVRGLRACLIGDEPTITELVHTRSLRKLHLSQLAPTVAGTPLEPGEVLTALRAAGLSPVAEDATGTVIIEARREHAASPPGRSPGSARGTARAPVAPTELAQQLIADPRGEAAGAPTDLGSFADLRKLNERLDDAQVALLADAVDNGGDIVIAYRAASGSRTVRTIAPTNFYGRWLDSWCYLRNAQRDFTVANIESVAPVR